jgi:Flp pilus assembly protein TadB
MSRQRAIRRAEREAAAEKARARRARRVRRRAFLRRLRPSLPRRRRTGRLPSGLTRAERGAIIAGTVTALGLVWLLVDGLSTRIALTALIVLFAPAMFVLTLDRRT